MQVPESAQHRNFILLIAEIRTLNFQSRVNMMYHMPHMALCDNLPFINQFYFGFAQNAVRKRDITKNFDEDLTCLAKMHLKRSE